MNGVISTMFEDSFPALHVTFASWIPFLNSQISYLASNDNPGLEITHADNDRMIPATRSVVFIEN